MYICDFFNTNHCDKWNVYLQDSYVEVLTPSVVVFGDEAIRKKLGLDEVMRVGHQDGIVPL